jgi:hypothetical protein
MTDAAQTSQPLPLSGQRPLSAKERLQRSQALACNLPEKNKPSCTGQVFLGMFFDGTGNNRDRDIPENKHSNVVRLWRVHLDNSKSLAVAPPVLWRKEYVPGVGTPFPLIGDNDDTSIGAGLLSLGNAMAAHAQSRIIWGLLQTINVLHRYIKGGNPLLSDEEAANFAKGYTSLLSTSISELKSKVTILKGILHSAKPTVTLFNISVFGFSRGAAQARTFCTSFYQLCEKSGDGYTFAGVPVRICFLGIFDTVASAGITSAGITNETTFAGHYAWANGTLAIHPAIERCVHFVASHEVRGCFPLDSVRYKGKYPNNCREVVYPGVHSDVGGGYKPLTQGRSALPSDGNSYSFSALMPCIDMHKEAIASGVPLKTLGQMLNVEARDFTASDKATKDYNAFIKADSAGGSVEEQFKQRMHRYRFYRYKRLATYPDDAEKQGSPSEDTKFLRLTNDDFGKSCGELKRKYANIAKIEDKDKSLALAGMGSVANDGKTSGERKRDALTHSLGADNLEMWEGMHRVGHLSDEQVAFFDHYLHDSIAGFAQDKVHEFAFNGQGHFRNRTVYDDGGES